MAGGAWYDLGSYAVACAAAMLGRPTGSVTITAAAVTEKHAMGVDGTTEGELWFPGNGTASFRVSLQDANAKNTLTAIGTKGCIVIEAPFHHPSAFAVNGRRVEMPLKGHGLWYQAAEVQSCVKRGLLESPSCTWIESEAWASTLEGVARAARLPALITTSPPPESLSVYRSHLRVAVIGLGRIGSLHTANLKALGVGQVVSFAKRLATSPLHGCSLKLLYESLQQRRDSVRFITIILLQYLLQQASMWHLNSFLVPKG